MAAFFPSRASRRAAWLVLTLLALAATGCAPMVQLEPLGTLPLAAPEETSVVLAADGTVLAELHAEQDRDVVALEDMPSTLREAVIAVEDARFYEHAGLDARAVARAALRNTTEGRVLEGGSTITQQLAKNTVVGTAPTLQRKLSEASVALQLEAQLSKDDILERYLNTVYFGHGSYGAQTAARRWFGVDVGELTLAQAATLAGVLRAPGSYDPVARPEVVRRRRDLVLALMAAQGRADTAAVTRAQAEPLATVIADQPDDWKAPYFVDHVLTVLQHDPAFAALGADPVERADRLYRGGLTITTTLDPAWQESAQHAVAQTVSEADDPRAALVAIDPTSGGIRALVGGRDWTDPEDATARFNLATDGARQPGSTFKPLVLAAALRAGHTLDEVFPGGASVSIPLAGASAPWQVHNYDDENFGPLSLAAATAFSVNVTYARLIDEVGPAAVVDLARAAGIRRELAAYHSVALGAQEVSVLEMASVQATFAAGGVYRQPSAVTAITGPDGQAVYTRGQTPGERVIDPGVAWLTTTALQGVVEHGTGEAARIGRPLAGKTGTTQDGADAWFTGYTPDLAAAVWIGFPQGRVPMVPPRTRSTVEGGTWPSQLFARFAMRALADVPARDFPVPAVALTTVELDVTRGCLALASTPPEFVEQRSYLPGTAPTQRCPEPATDPSPVPDPPPVPDVLGEHVEDARAALTEAGFDVEVVAACPDGGQECTGARERPGRVWQQSPDAGAAALVDDPVRLSAYPG